MACKAGQALLQKKYMVSVRGSGQQEAKFEDAKDTMETLFRLLEDDPHSALNARQTAACSPIQGRSRPDSGPADRLCPLLWVSMHLCLPFKKREGGK